MSKTHIWTKQKTDTPKSFEAFCIYRDMGSNRSLRKVTQKLNKSLTLIFRWNDTHNWQERVNAYDEHQLALRNERMQERQILIEDNAYDDYEYIRLSIDKYKSDYGDENFVGVKPYDIQALLELMKKSDDHARRAVGLPDKITTSKQELTGKNGGDIIIRTGMSLDDL